jgi:hypothetical protein
MSGAKRDKYIKAFGNYTKILSRCLNMSKPVASPGLGCALDPVPESRRQL